MKRKYKTTERWGEKVRGVEGGGGGGGGGALGTKW